MSARVQTASQKPEGHSRERVTAEREGGGREEGGRGRKKEREGGGEGLAFSQSLPSQYPC